MDMQATPISDQETGTKVVRTNCRACGHAGCGVFVTLENGKAVNIRGDKEHPISKGYLCRKARGFIADLQYHRDRLLYPMKRAGERGEGKWERISWDEALGTIAEKVQYDQGGERA